MTQSKQNDAPKAQHVNAPEKPVTETTGELPVAVNEAHYYASSAPRSAIIPKHILALQRTVGNRSVQKVLQRHHSSTPQAGPVAVAGVVQRHPDDAASQWRTSALQQHETKLSQHDESIVQNVQAIEANKQDIALNSTTDKAVQETLFNWVEGLEGRVQQSETNIQQLAAKTQALESQSIGGEPAEIPATGGF